VDVDLGPGRHELSVRTGGQQAEPREGGVPATPYPYGSAGFHTVEVDAIAGAAVPSRPPRRREAAAVARERTLLAAQGARAWLTAGRPRPST
jgi:hypothetical protein